jgi:tetratricopeptide (TPR) repeat protein
VAAYAKRAGTRLLPFAYNYDTSEQQLRRARADLEVAERLAPDDPYVLGAKGHFLLVVDLDTEGAVNAFSAAEAAGLQDLALLTNKASALMILGRFEEALRACERAVTLDPRNAYALTAQAGLLATLREPVDAIRVLDFASAQRPELAPGLRGFRAEIVYAYTGRSELQEPPESDTRTNDPDPGALSGQFAMLRRLHSYDELERVLDRAGTDVIRADILMVGKQPIARYQGWTQLLRNDREGAERAGRKVLAFVASERETKWNRGFLHLLAAEANTFIGNSKLALDEIRQADGLAQQRPVGSLIPAVYAWNGALDQAVQMLEASSTAIPGLSPAEIARDPLFSVPLAHHPRYQALTTRLEAQMAATKLE